MAFAGFQLAFRMTWFRSVFKILRSLSRGKTCGKTKFCCGKLAPPPGGPGKRRGRKTTFHASVKINISKGPKAGPKRDPQFEPRRIGHANFLTLNVQGTCCTGHPDQGHLPWLGPDLGRGLNMKFWLLCVLQPLFSHQWLYLKKYMRHF